jgi:hypothetical protein
MVFNPYAPLRFGFDPNDVNYIPAIPEPRRDAREEPIGYTGHVIPISSRDQVALLREPIDDPAWRRQSPRLGFGEKTGELHWHFYAWEIDPEFCNKSLMYYQKKCGAENIKVNVAWLCPGVVREMVHRLRVNGFCRKETLERADSTQQAWVQSPAKQWRG